MGIDYQPPGGSGGGTSDHGALTGLSDDDHTQYTLRTEGAGAPGTTPSRTGLIYVDTTDDVTYVSTGTTSSADWTDVSTAGGSSEGIMFGPDVTNGTIDLYHPSLNDYLISTFNAVADTIYFVPFLATAGTTYNRIGIDVTSANGGATARLGIYKADSSSGGPGTLVVDAGTVSVGTTGIKEITISETLDDVKYFLCVISDGGPILRGFNNAVVPKIMGTTNPSGKGILQISKTAAGEHTSLSDPAVSSLTTSATMFFQIFLRKV
mgnify:CR=1 FL=1